MKSRSKEVNIFSMSALDLFASALGAFILISVVLFPYFPNTGDSQERVDEVKAQLEQTSAQLEQAGAQLEQTSEQLEHVQGELRAVRGQLGACQTQRRQIQAALDSCEEQKRAAESTDSALGACQSRNRQVQEELQSCEQQLRKKFVLIVISWGTVDDIDLHVIDPAGREFFFGRKFHSGSRAKLEEDNIRGPGNEIWLHPAAESGEYRVYYNYFSRRSARGVQVRGAVLTPRGRTELPTRALRRQGDKPLVATITVDSEGNANISTR